MANKRICIPNVTFGEWRQLRKKLPIRNDDLLPRYLLSYRTAHEAISFDERLVGKNYMIISANLQALHH